MKAKTLLVSVLALGAMTSVALAAPVELNDAQADSVTAGKITKTNNGGNTPNGQANGIPSKNPAGHEPGGHNK